MYKSYLAVFSENVFQVSSISSYCQTSNKQVVTRISVFVITTASIKGKIFFFKKNTRLDFTTLVLLSENDFCICVHYAHVQENEIWNDFWNVYLFHLTRVDGQLLK